MADQKSSQSNLAKPEKTDRQPGPAGPGKAAPKSDETPGEELSGEATPGLTLTGGFGHA